jgi:hypothetical protein
MISKEVIPAITLLSVSLVLNKFFNYLTGLERLVAAFPSDVPSNPMPSNQGWSFVIKFLTPDFEFGTFCGRAGDSLNNRVDFIQDHQDLGFGLQTARFLSLGFRIS